MAHILGGFQLPFQRRLTKLYTDTKVSYEFVKEPVQVNDDPDVSALHRKLRIQKDRLISWGLEWSDPSQSPDIDESLLRAGLGDVVGSVMSTIKDILAEAEPLWISSRRNSDNKGEKSDRPVDSKTSLVSWDRSKFEDLIRDLTGSIDILYDLSRTRQNARQTPTKQFVPLASLQTKAAGSQQAKAFEAARMKTPQQIDPTVLINPKDYQDVGSFSSLSAAYSSGENSSRYIVYMQKRSSSGSPWKMDAAPALTPLLLEYSSYDPIYASTGITPEMDRFEKLFAGLQTVQGMSGPPEYGTLDLIGYFEDAANARFGLLYEMPNRLSTWDNQGRQLSKPGLVALSNIILNPVFEPALEVKYRLAQNLTSTIQDLHTKGIVHGNLTSGNIVFMEQKPISQEMTSSKISLRCPFITSFDLFSDNTQQSASGGHESAQELLYRYPFDTRHATVSNLTHDNALIDMYSMGLLLLEVGLWRPLTEIFPDQTVKFDDLTPYFRQLSIKCGNSFSNIVQGCLSAFEKTTSTMIEDSSVLQSLYTRISSALERCCAIDEGDISETMQLTYEHEPFEILQPTSKNLGTTEQGSDQEVIPPKLEHKSIQNRPDIQRSRLQAFQAHSVKAQDVVSKLKLRIFTAVDIDQHHWDTWNQVLMPTINKALRGFYKKYPESVEISLESVGESVHSTRPTILVVCTSVGKVRKILQKHFVYDSATYGLLVCRGRLFRSRKPSTRRSAAGTPAMDFQTPENPDYQPRPLNGASIGAYVDGQHLPPVSFGGLVIVGNKQYGLTVHHMLDDPEIQSYVPPLSQSTHQHDSSYIEPPKFENLDEEDGYAISEHGSDYSETTSDSDVYSEDDNDDQVHASEVGDIEGVFKDCGDGYAITQPALDDVDEAFYANEDTMDEDHLETYKLGEIFASSGIRRRYQDGIAHEIDWALFEFEEKREPIANYIKGGEQHCRRKERYPVEIAPWSSLSGLEIHCNGRTTGLQTGRILPGMSIVKVFGRQTPSQSYQVSGRLGVPGDSGAWIVDNTEGRACGHILAWSSRKQVAYICPMEIIFADIAETLDAPVSLPSAHIAEISSFNQYVQSDSDVIQNEVGTKDGLDRPIIENEKHLTSMRYTKRADDELISKMHGLHVSHGLISQS